MIRAVLRDGLIHPLEPLPAEWSDGRELRVDEAEPSDHLDDLDQWYQELEALGAALYEPGEREQIQAIMEEADEQAKAIVRREMGLP